MKDKKAKDVSLKGHEAEKENKKVFTGFDGGISIMFKDNKDGTRRQVTAVKGDNTMLVECLLNAVMENADFAEIFRDASKLDTRAMEIVNLVNKGKTQEAVDKLFSDLDSIPGLKEFRKKATGKRKGFFGLCR